MAAQAATQANLSKFYVADIRNRCGNERPFYREYAATCLGGRLRGHDEYVAAVVLLSDSSKGCTMGGGHTAMPARFSVRYLILTFVMPAKAGTQTSI